MRTEGWDEKLRACPAGSVVYLDSNYRGESCFPAVHADALGVIGGWSRCRPWTPGSNGRAATPGCW